MAAKKNKYEVVAEFGCGGGDAKHPSKCWWAERGEVIKLTSKEAEGFVAQELIKEI